MRQKLIQIFSTILVLIFCQSTSLGQSQKIKDEISALITLQEHEWNKGNIEGFMSFYWHSDSLTFVSKNGVTYGFENVLRNYKNSYSDKEKMGILKFGNLSYNIVDKNNVIVIGSWELSNKTANTGGYFTLWWKKIKNNWKIILDHTS